MKKIVILLTLIFFFSCKNEEKKIVFSKPLKKVPLIYKDASNYLFQMHQDTLYFNNKKFSGIQYSLYKQGDTAFIKPYLNGLEEGITKKWYVNKQLAEERLYIDGKKEGIHKGWWENGNRKFEFAVSNDEYTNEFKEWSNSGLLVKYFHYKNGQENGRQQLYYENGKIRANYVILNGKRYGLLGTKNCKNVSDSIFNSK
ncbi:toxin-antitoxin system YwqK family antitoxin [Flavobacterium polysaccharolyticum]|uniref:Toxin-antitoxin system YwqK family antitoxin n=1 Tax=Flavobacterium polysaccharolyticum TaxID=3133148 RepID=A0ABU9NNR0_9FLAO